MIIRIEKIGKLLGFFLCLFRLSVLWFYIFCICWHEFCRLIIKWFVVGFDDRLQSDQQIPAYKHAISKIAIRNSFGRRQNKSHSEVLNQKERFFRIKLQTNHLFIQLLADLVGNLNSSTWYSLRWYWRSADRRTYAKTPRVKTVKSADENSLNEWCCLSSSSSQSSLSDSRNSLQSTLNKRQREKKRQILALCLILFLVCWSSFCGILLLLSFSCLFKCLFDFQVFFPFN